MSRAISGAAYLLGLLAVVVAIWNIHFGEPVAGQTIVGGLGLAIAFFYAVTLQVDFIHSRFADEHACPDQHTRAASTAIRPFCPHPLESGQWREHAAKHGRDSVMESVVARDSIRS